MKSGSEDALAAVLLASRLASDGLQPFKASECWRLIGNVGRPGALLGQSEDQLVNEHGLSREDAARVRALFARATAVAFAVDELDQSGITTVTPFDDDYPTRFVERLGSKAPPVLHAAGDRSLFARAGLGVVGTRDVSKSGAEIAKLAAQMAARLGVPLVSGGARGVDQLSMEAARGAGGSAVGFLADSMVRTLKQPDVRRAIHAGSTLLCTPYGPDAPFSAGNAMGRNKLIYAQSLVTFVVASDRESGGTWSGAVEALKGAFGRVAVWRGDGEGPGNAALEERGATAITSVDDLESLLTEPEVARVVAPSVASQPALFD